MYVCIQNITFDPLVLLKSKKTLTRLYTDLLQWTLQQLLFLTAIERQVASWKKKEKENKLGIKLIINNNHAQMKDLQ